MSKLPLERQLRQATLLARERVYRFGQATPLERLVLPGKKPGPEIWIKREDLSPIKAYKWRGACNRMAILNPDEAAQGVVTASAGNHAQGIALAAKTLAIRARIYMPLSTPKVKQDAVRYHGGEYVEIILSGDSYDEAVTAAIEDEKKSGALYIHAYDDLDVMAGQGTLADEVILSGHGPFDVAYLQIGGGGMAGAVSLWLKTYWPNIEIVGVEAIGQASMKAALEAGQPVTLEHLDIFCDGTAVRKAGTLPFEICKQTIDRMETVTNDEVSSAISTLWESARCISEPSGAMGLAAVIKNRKNLVGKRVLVILSGANIDFLQLGLIAQSQATINNSTRTLRVHIPSEAGSMLKLIEQCFGDVDLTDFQYGKQSDIDAWPVFTASSEDPSILDSLSDRLNSAGYEWEDLSGATDVLFRAIPMRTDLLKNPAFLRLDFYERPGALRTFLHTLRKHDASICYFNYRQSGERIGRALIGIEFPSIEKQKETFASIPKEHGEGYRSYEILDEAANKRLSLA